MLVLAALENALTDKNAGQVKAKLVLELANGPVTYDAYKKLAARKIQMVPDILANAGGVIVSYLEWVQNRAGEHWSEDKVNSELESLLVKAAGNVYAVSDAKKLTLKEAAFALAIERLSA